MRIESKFFRPMFPGILQTHFDDGTSPTLDDIHPWDGEKGYRCRRYTPEEQVLEDECLELWKSGNRVFAYHLESKRWVSRREFGEIVDRGE